MRNFTKALSVLTVTFSISACTAGPTNVNFNEPVNVNTSIPIGLGNDAIDKLTGTVTSVDTQNSTFKVKSENGQEDTVKVPQNQISSIKAGDRVTLNNNKRTKVEVIVEGKIIPVININNNEDTDIKIISR
ncbi:MAG: hypothetical protein U0354_15620 [Candidatus Sericytochromatia bacterium]